MDHTNSEMRFHPGIKGLANPNDLRQNLDWLEKFFKAGQYLRIVEIETKMALDELKNLQTQLASKFGNGLSSHYGSNDILAVLFELHNNRPAYVNNVVTHTLQQTGGQNISDVDFHKILQQQVINEYKNREKDPNVANRVTKGTHVANT